MRKISAHYIFPVGAAPLKNGIVVLDDGGLILDVIDTGGILREAENIEFYNGILVPGFINAHCHLELSHLRGKFAEKTGLCGFIRQVKELRESNPDEIITEAARADREM
ncbi:MAG: S-adenosylhomocysteine deaminase, partial [Bacteroidota bacterium]|nr:S-adenosylhomocysteine deaminase [Bacteroidota bacterium]